jgi:hypothetical protein
MVASATRKVSAPQMTAVPSDGDAVLDRIADDEKTGRGRRRNGQEKRETRRFRTLEAEAARRRHGDAGAAVPGLRQEIEQSQ